MKTLKSTMMGLALVAALGITKAAAIPANTSLTKEEAINTYLNAVVHGQEKGLENAIDEEAQFKLIRGTNVHTLNKQQEIDALKGTENIEQNCKCVKTVVQDTEEISTTKVEMQFADFTRTDVITEQRAGGGGWKITEVDTSYK